MTKERMLQDVFLNKLCKSGETVTVYLVNEIKLRVKIKAFDRFVVMVGDSATTRMVYKHAISTIACSEAEQPSGNDKAPPDEDIGRG